MEDETNEIMPHTEDYQFDALANEYNEKKRHTFSDLLLCGKIISKAKKELEHGKFMRWLGDKRVSESVKTSERMMKLFSNYCQVLENPTKDYSYIEKVGMVKLLELEKLPTIYKKTVDITNDAGHVEKIEVIDEDKVEQILDKGIYEEGKITKVKDLPLNRFKEIIKQESGDFSSDSEGDVSESKGDDLELKPIETPYLTSSSMVISVLSDQAQWLWKDLDKYDDTRLFEMSETEKETLIASLKLVKGHLTALVVKIDDFIMKGDVQ
jgi:hypothetical protein